MGATTQKTTNLTATETLNDFETVIGVDTSSNEPEIHLFESMQAKLEVLEAEAQKLANYKREDATMPTAAVAAEE